MGEIHSGTLLTTPELQGGSAGVVPSWVWMLVVEYLGSLWGDVGWDCMNVIVHKVR